MKSCPKKFDAIALQTLYLSFLTVTKKNFKVMALQTLNLSFLRQHLILFTSVEVNEMLGKSKAAARGEFTSDRRKKEW